VSHRRSNRRLANSLFARPKLRELNGWSAGLRALRSLLRHRSYYDNMQNLVRTPSGRTIPLPERALVAGKLDRRSSRHSAQSSSKAEDASTCDFTQRDCWILVPSYRVFREKSLIASAVDRLQERQWTRVVDQTAFASTSSGWVHHAGLSQGGCDQMAFVQLSHGC
jgi:hypothetical protein